MLDVDSSSHMKPYPLAFCGLIAFYSSIFLPSDGLASSFDAICDSDRECVVAINDGILSVNGLVIPSKQIISWGETEAKSKRKPQLCLLSLTACALTIFHDYRYYVDYADDQGVLSKLTFRFVNDRPAKQLVRELTTLTNLASGQSSEVATTWALNRRAEVDHQKLVDKLNCSPVLKPYKCSYYSYLNSNPGAKLWAELNPTLAKQQILQMKAVEGLQ